MASQTVDNVIATVMTMGFDLGDCQEAVQYGKITVEEIVEWILAGKPGLAALPSQPPRLHLGRQTNTDSNLLNLSSNPFVAPIPLQETTSSSPAKTSRDLTSDNLVVSRHHLTDDKRRDKELFEEKRREEAKKKARDEKIAQRKEKERILQQIAEDRDTKLKKENKNVEKSPSSSSQSPSTSSNSSSTCTSTPVNTQSLSAQHKCTLQIRLPDGRCLRKMFEYTSTLNDVWDYVYTEFKALNNMTFMQPFPRQEFSKEDMKRTVEDLGLTPTGSLVLKPATVVEQSVSDSMEDNSTDEISENEPMEEEESIRSRLRPRHQWGQGHRLEGEGEIVDAMEIPDDDREEDIVQFAQNNLPQGQFPGMPFLNMDELNQPFGGHGQRLLPQGHPDADVVQNRPAGQVAAEAALQRSQHPVPVAEEIQDVHELLKPVRSLLNLVFHHLAERINDPKSPLLSLSGISEDLALKLVSYLQDKGMLKPKTLRAFIPCYLRKLVLDCYPLTTNELLQAVRLHSNLSVLSLNSCPLITDTGLQSISGMKRLKVLNLGSCKQLTNKCLLVMKALPSLQSLNLTKTSVNDNGITTHVIPHCVHLQHLNLNSTSVTHAFIPPLKALVELKSLQLEDTKVCSLSGIQYITTLQQLNISNTDIFNDALLCLAQLPSLTSLNISGTERVNGDLGLQYLAGLKLQNLVLPSRHSTTDQGMTFLTGFPLVVLDLTNYINIGDEGVSYIGKIHSLKKLLLSNTKTGDAGLISLKDLVNLEVLYLDRTSVTDEGTRVIKEFKKLNELSLAATKITSDILVEGILNQCYLTKVNLSKNKITETGVVCLRSKSLQLLNLNDIHIKEREITNMRKILQENCPALISLTISSINRVVEEEPMVI
ncbi:hypothetical protein SNE40_023190 [Patella caerulea]